jgi:hypothetical protein
MSSSIAGVLIGLVVGLRHALEPDHLTAVATLATETRSVRRGAALGALWGLGHTVSLIAVAVVLIAFGEALPERLAAAFELAVSFVLVGLGVRAIVRASREGQVGPVHAHAHGGHSHVHAGPDAHVHLGRWTLAWRPLAVGLVHGLAGSGALTAFAFAKLATTGERLSYIVLFGLGSIAAMALASALVGMWLRTFVRQQRWLSFVAGAVSIVLGVVWSVPLWSQLG